jgi:hypothetical protein
MSKLLRPSWALAAAASLFAGAANANFILVDNWSPTGSAAVAVPSINNFRTQLSSAGVPSFYLGRSLSVTGAQAGDAIEIDFFAAEAGFRNRFYWGSSLVIDNLGNQAWAERDRGTVTASNGLQNFTFCAVNVLACMSNAGNDLTRIGSYQSIGMYLTNGGSTAWLLWDDSGANMDDNHDDLVVRLTYRSVPEPGTLALLGLGLIGVAFMGRRKIART